MRQNSKVVARIITILGGLAVALTLVPAQNASAYVSTRFHNHIVYVENHAPGFPVRRAAEDLDNYNGLDLRVVRHCPVEEACIRVYTQRNLPGRAIGVTYTFMSGGHTVGAKVVLERKWGRHATYRERRAVACHELGHAIGLNHDHGHTCMNSTIGRYTSPTINRHERKQLRRWY